MYVISKLDYFISYTFSLYCKTTNKITAFSHPTITKVSFNKELILDSRLKMQNSDSIKKSDTPVHCYSRFGINYNIFN